MKISIIGTGYVGLVSGACFAELGNTVICADNDPRKVANLKKGEIPIFEPGLEELVKKNVKTKRLSFTSSIKDAVVKSDIIFIAVGTPSLENGEADLTGIENVARNIAINMSGYKLIVEKSTVPVETGEWVKKTILNNRKRSYEFDVASNPEFLREGSAIGDFMNPDRVVIGVESKKARELLTMLYRPLKAPIVVTDIKSAELIKHASNSFLATKISFINAVSRVCDKVGADINEVAYGMGLDKRIGPQFLCAGIGYGGSCFPKDVDAFVTITDKIGYDFELLKAVREINQQQKKFFLGKVKENLWIIKDKTVGILGISFKPNTDDIRSAPALDFIRFLLQEGAHVKVYDPSALEKAKAVLQDTKIRYCTNAYEVARGSDCLLLVTEWDEFKELDFLKIKKLLKRPLLIDGRNVYDPVKMKALGFTYVCIGRRSARKG
ncbi:MAG TPA: UDP-glucose/GDP-mannose dehydrogenase family protein [Candidatus Omnitrophota bacterium]|nr:UDP-glucose/GDP-mannose dehydrogenase family protein [Candidatus Omnitrophota bacterium]HPT07672.1 UDP-glucose/GDP-mannose dehydrogenase family protein [Candidatus Omnitrophota bacterium]